MADLQARALTDIRKQPGCSGVRDVAINHLTDDRAESNWSLSVASAGAADARAARRGAIMFSTPSGATIIWKLIDHATLPHGSIQIIWMRSFRKSTKERGNNAQPIYLAH
jgi:hypothetical protein